MNTAHATGPTRRGDAVPPRGLVLALCLLGSLAVALPALAGGSQGATAAALAIPADLPPDAFGEGAIDRDTPRLRGRLLLHPEDPSAVGVLLEVDAGWHLYWRNPGDSGLATEIEFSVVGEPGQAAGALAWPTPYSFGESDGEGEELITYGYGDRVLLSARLSEPLRVGQNLSAEVSALVCERQCIPASLSLSRRVPGERGVEDARRARALFSHFAAELPTRPEVLGAQVEILWSQSALRPGDQVEGAIALTSCAGRDCVPLELGVDGISFFPEDGEGLAIKEIGRRALREAPENLDTLAVRASVEPGAPARLRGVLVALDAEGRRRGLEVDLPLPTASAQAPVEGVALPWADASEVAPESVGTKVVATRESGLGLLAVLWFAFLGGLILNLMPCVLPVLAIKVFSVADLAHRSRREVLSHGVAYSAGILVTMSALAGAVIALRSAGHSVGWGFQFQEPLFVAFVCTVVVVFALNLLGVFEIRFDPGQLAAVGAEASGPRRSFFEGLLAVILATPCSAPFLGTAVGFAFSSSPAEIFGVFAAIGAGLAAPYALITAIPGWSHIVPRPGPWMVKLRAGLGFLLLGSAVWLTWVLGRSAGLDAVTNLLAFLLVVAFLAWVYGNLPDRHPVWAPLGIAAVLVSVGVLIADNVVLESGNRARGDDTLGAVYDAAEIEAQLEGGRSVFAYFTADWCITCKVNEKRVLARAEVRAELERRDVAVFRGDWTHRDEAIRKELARYGKAGVPVYVVRHPQAPSEPIVLPELLSAERLFAALSPSQTPKRKSTLAPSR